MRPLPRRTLATIATVALAACGESAITEPTLQPDVAAVATGMAASNGGVAICHRDNGKNEYKLQIVSTSAVLKHISHGDVFPGGSLGSDCQGAGTGGGGGTPGGVLDDAASYYTPLYGGTGGYPFSDPCPTGYVGVGLKGSVATWYGWATVAHVQLECRELLADGTLGATAFTPQRGTGAAATMLTAFAETCGGGELLMGARGAYGNYMGSLTGTCATFARIASALGGEDSTIGPFAGTGDFGRNATFDTPCNPGYVITGLYGRSGDVVDAFGFRCTPVRVP